MFFDSFNVDKTSCVFPDTLVDTTSIFESIVFGKGCPLIIDVWILVLERIEAMISPITPEHPRTISWHN